MPSGRDHRPRGGAWRSRFCRRNARSGGAAFRHDRPRLMAATAPQTRPGASRATARLPRPRPAPEAAEQPEPAAEAAPEAVVEPDTDGSGRSGGGTLAAAVPSTRIPRRSANEPVPAGDPADSGPLEAAAAPMEREPPTASTAKAIASTTNGGRSRSRRRTSCAHSEPASTDQAMLLPVPRPSPGASDATPLRRRTTEDAASWRRCRGSHPRAAKPRPCPGLAPSFLLRTQRELLAMQYYGFQPDFVLKAALDQFSSARYADARTIAATHKNALVPALMDWLIARRTDSGHVGAGNHLDPDEPSRLAGAGAAAASRRAGLPRARAERRFGARLSTIRSSRITVGGQDGARRRASRSRAQLRRRRRSRARYGATGRWLPSQAAALFSPLRQRVDQGGSSLPLPPPRASQPQPRMPSRRRSFSATATAISRAP